MVAGEHEKQPDGAQVEEYTVRWVGWDEDPLGGPYLITGPVIPGGHRIFPRCEPVRWEHRTWTLWGAKRAIRNHKRTKIIVHREEA